ncbi:chloride channel [Rhodocollybia butyracea]|uniref:Chloride channel n=1 Tax=Rhodocollybia butyracea TaxID=206335 RepID=A0A9P5UA10_9AGAR|nr:chloride channel [Rhodocollybia butyracea]
MSDIGPNAAPSPTFVRRAKLQRLGSMVQIDNAPSASVSQGETSPLKTRSHSDTTYGTISRLPLHRRSIPFLRKTPPNLSSLPPATSGDSASQPSSPFTPSSLRHLSFSRISTQRPISAYDTTLEFKDGQPVNTSLDVKKNGVRVWYSSYSSIDWLHDSIKESIRFSRLRSRKSMKAYIRLAFDRLQGWIIVTLVGFLTALVAFFVVKSEQWLFDLKDGYCTAGWSKAKQYCCSQSKVVVTLFPTSATHVDCPSWRQWSDVLSWGHSDRGQVSMEFLAYTCVAILLAVTSCWLTLFLTKSTTFVTRKESGVLGPGFRDESDAPPRKVFYYAAGSGIPELKAILSGFVIHGFLGFRVLFAKAVGLALSVASGLQLGKEGPFVHIASCIGNIVCRLSSKYETNEAKRREILSAACAAGVAVAFGAPIGGTLFSLEEVSYFFPAKVMWRSFFCAMIAAITLKLLNPFGTGKLVLFQVTYGQDWHAFELLPFVILGVFGGVYGAYFSKLNFRWSRDVRNATWLKNHPVTEVLLVTLATSAFCFLNPYTRMGGTELVGSLFSECHKGVEDEWGLCISDPGSWTELKPVVGALLLALVVRGVLTVVTFGIRLPAGIFIPSLAAGGLLGRVVGILLQYSRYRNPDLALFRSCSGDNCIVPGLYAMVGAAATLAGVTRTTVSLAVIMFELTDTLSYTIPIMITVLVAKTTADALEERGIYELVINIAQLPYLDSNKTYNFGDRQIADVIVRDADVIRLDEENTVITLRDKLQTLLHQTGNDDSGFPILKVDDKNDEDDEERMRLVGFLGARELEHSLYTVSDHPDEIITFHATAHHSRVSSSLASLADDANRPDDFDFSVYMDQAPLTINHNAPLEVVHAIFVKLGARYVVVTDVDGYYEGVIDKKIWIAFLTEVSEH